jgi:hypothetical protein
MQLIFVGSDFVGHHLLDFVLTPKSGAQQVLLVLNDRMEWHMNITPSAQTKQKKKHSYFFNHFFWTPGSISATNQGSRKGD